MFVFRKVVELQNYISRKKQAGSSIGFVPTMGALHQGHLSLIKRSQSATDITVCSIFVNPTQFDDPSDLEKYPRTTALDMEKLLSVNCDILFIPTVEEVYPSGVKESPNFSFGEIEQVLEGAYREGHFDGVAQVVNRLLEIVQPHQLFMGQKDFQQQLIITKMLQILNSEIELVRCPIFREKDGLAMSSRNVRLNDAERAAAPLIYKTISAIMNQYSHGEVDKLKQWGKKELEDSGWFNVDYLEIVDASNLKQISDWSEAKEILICVAAYLGKVRLIDNVLIS